MWVDFSREDVEISFFVASAQDFPYDCNVADLVDAPDDGPLRPRHVVLRV
jgi:hypothetical protein